MERNIDYIIANPAGNITILVLTPVDRTDYQRVARRLLAACPEAEQVGYVLPSGYEERIARSPKQADWTQEFSWNIPPTDLPRMEMCGLEFCGNASRSFAYYEAMRAKPPLSEIVISVSGSEEPLRAWIDVGECSDRIEMPVPSEMDEVSIPISADFARLVAEASGQTCDTKTGGSIDGLLVHMDGISHFVVTSIPYEIIETMDHDTMEDLFLHIRGCVYEITDRDLPALGVMFYDSETSRLTPIVYVRDVDTIYFEGSCASGSAATAYAMSVSDPAVVTGSRTYTMKQPAGTLQVEVSMMEGLVQSMILQGSVELSEVRQITIDL